jgi:hypothetical protein
MYILGFHTINAIKASYIHAAILANAVNDRVGKDVLGVPACPAIVYPLLSYHFPQNFQWFSLLLLGNLPHQTQLFHSAVVWASHRLTFWGTGVVLPSSADPFSRSFLTIS